MSNLLNSAAVGTKEGDEAQEILSAYIATQPVMVLSHTLSAQSQPKGTGAGDHLITPGA